MLRVTKTALSYLTKEEFGGMVLIAEDKSKKIWIAPKLFGLDSKNIINY